jgi:hypothetical protein
LTNQIDFTKRLLSYSVFGAAAALTAGPAQGAIIANTTPQPFDVVNGTFAFINFDGVGANEFEVRGYQTPTTTFGTNTIGFVGLYRTDTNFLHLEDSNPANGGGFSDPNALPLGFIVGPGGTFLSGEPDADSIVRTEDGAATATGGNFQNFIGQVRYIGTQFLLGGNTHFGWIGVQLNSDLLTGTVTGYAYEACAGEAIETGATTGGATCGPGSGVIPEPSSLALMAAGAAGIFALRRRRKTA